MLIQVKNYRCFNQENPLKLDLKKGTTSFIGPNNSGKSSIFRFIFDMRPIWTQLKDPLTIQKITGKNTGNVISLPDQTALNDTHFSNLNENNIEIEINLYDSELFEIPNGNHISKVTIILDRRTKKYSLILTTQTGIQTNSLTHQWSSESYLKPSSGDGSAVYIKHIYVAAEILERCIYFDANRFIASKFGGKNFDLILGREFVSQWRRLKMGNESHLRRKAIAIQNSVKSIFNFKSLEVNPSDSGDDMAIVINNEPYNLSELGDGISQFLVALGSSAILYPSYILIDEPERGLHASMQIDFITSLASYAEYGLLFTTHSLGLARSISNCGVYSVTMKEYSIVQRIEKEPELPELLGMLNYSAQREVGYTKILLVEGTTEVKIFKQFLKFFLLDQQVVILPLGGSSLIRGDVEHEISEIARLAGGNISAIVDSEKNSSDAPLHQDRIKFQDICRKLKIPCLLTEKRATENYFTERAIKKAFPRHSHQPLESFERLNNRWAKADNWKIAAEMSKADIESTDIGKFISQYLCE